MKDEKAELELETPESVERVDNQNAPADDNIIEQKKDTQEVLQTNEESADSDSPTEETVSKHEDVILESAQTETDTYAGIIERLTAIEEEIKHSNQLIESKFLRDVSKDEEIIWLHEELQKCKDDLFKKILKPIFMDMILFADSMKALVSHYEEVPETELMLERYQKLRKEFLKVGSHIDDLVFNYGIEPFSSKLGDKFDPKIQQANKTTPTENSEEHKKIVTSLASGYTWDNQLLRRESVHVYVKS